MVLAMKVVLILANSTDPDEMQHKVAFHLGLHCLPKYSLGFPVYKGLKFRALPLLIILWFRQQCFTTGTFKFNPYIISIASNQTFNVAIVFFCLKAFGSAVAQW